MAVTFSNPLNSVEMNRILAFYDQVTQSNTTELSQDALAQITSDYQTVADALRQLPEGPISEQPDSSEAHYLADLNVIVGKMYAIALQPRFEQLFCTHKNFIENDLKPKIASRVAAYLKTLRFYDPNTHLYSKPSIAGITMAKTHLPALYAGIKQLFESFRKNSQANTRLHTEKVYGDVKYQKNNIKGWIREYAECKILTWAKEDERVKGISQLADYIIEFWAGFLENKKPVKMPIPEISLLTDRWDEIVAASLPSAEKVALFKKRLKDELLQVLARQASTSDRVIQLSTDYGPEGLLHNIAEEVGISALFPSKTQTHIRHLA